MLFIVWMSIILMKYNDYKNKDNINYFLSDEERTYILKICEPLIVS